MRICHVNKYYWPPHIGGVETQLHDLASGQALGSGNTVRAIVANESRTTQTDVIEGVEVRRLARTLAYASTPIAASMPRTIRAEMRRTDPADILHLHFPYPWGEVSWLRADAGLPTVLSYHSDIVRQKRLLAAYAPMLKRVLDRVDLIVTSSQNMIDYSPFLAGLSEKCRIIGYGIHPERYAETPQMSARVDALRAQHTRPIVLFVGRLVYYKGSDVLLRAMAEVDADLVIVGTGPLEGELREQAVAYGIADRVSWLPPLDDEELAAWFRAADVFCLPSVARSEAFGIVQLEAHASGTPVVATTLTTSVPRVNLDGVTGLNVEPGDAAALAAALRRLVGDAELRAKLGEQARERALGCFTVERMVNDMYAVYAEAIALHDRDTGARAGRAGHGGRGGRSGGAPSEGSKEQP